MYLTRSMKRARRFASAVRRRLNEAFRPKRYWPATRRPRDQRGNEVEIARITLDSQSRDAIVLQARRADRRIVYRMIHEDVHGRTRHRIRVKPPASTRPLTLGEVIAMLEGACYAGWCDRRDERYRGVIWGTLQLHLEHCGAAADDYLLLLKVSSRHYPQLERYYGERLDAWCLERATSG